jgi:signal transduction histidine kinase
VAPILQSVGETFLEQARSKSIELEIDYPKQPLLLNADPDRIFQVLSNLVSNALKFAPKDGKVSVDASAGPQEVCFAVRDTGPGIPVEARPHVFEKFWKTRNSGKPARGLGLYIAKMIVELHNGRIWVESDGRTGSAFLFTVPY